MLSPVIRRFYVHNYTCLENFELTLGALSSVLLLGRNGVGKSSVRRALELLQRIARGTSRVGDLLPLRQAVRRRDDAPIRFEIEVVLAGHAYAYAVAFELPDGFREFRVMDESLSVDGTDVFSRENSKVRLPGAPSRAESSFVLDWHLVALSIIQDRDVNDSLGAFKQWMGRNLILAPVPSHIGGYSDDSTLSPDVEMTKFAEWFRELTTQYPASYVDIDRQLRQVMPDLSVIQNKDRGGDGRELFFEFKANDQSLSVPFSALSDGEKVFAIGALTVAANKAYGPLVCFWDEPDNFVGLSEVGYLIQGMKKGYKAGGQLIVTSHNPEAIRVFTDESTLLMYRASHLEPTRIKPLTEVAYSGDLADAIARGDIDL